MTLDLNNGQYEYIQKLVKSESGIVLGAEKRYLAEARLSNMAAEVGVKDSRELLRRLRSMDDPKFKKLVVEAMTINETSFFRDVSVFTALKKIVIPELIKKRQHTKVLNVWCAACSTGQEPYSIAMLLKGEFPSLDDWTVRLMATDLDSRVLEQSQSGKYSQIEIGRGLPASMLVRHFEREGVYWRLNSKIRSMVEFRSMNLATEWPMLHGMDLILLRNVLIYFDVETKKEIFNRIKATLNPGGFLFLGGAETTVNIDNSFTPVRFDGAVSYQLNDSEISENGN